METNGQRYTVAYPNFLCCEKEKKARSSVRRRVHTCVVEAVVSEGSGPQADGFDALLRVEETNLQAVFRQDGALLRRSPAVCAAHERET
jgi:hypothetical protein